MPVDAYSTHTKHVIGNTFQAVISKLLPRKLEGNWKQSEYKVRHMQEEKNTLKQQCFGIFLHIQIRMLHYLSLKYTLPLLNVYTKSFKPPRGKVLKNQIYLTHGRKSQQKIST